VNGWNRVYPNNDVTLKNIQAMARDGQRLGATGLLNTSWADDGEAILNQQCTEFSTARRQAGRPVNHRSMIFSAHTVCSSTATRAEKSTRHR